MIYGVDSLRGYIIRLQMMGQRERDFRSGNFQVPRSLRRTNAKVSQVMH